LLACSILDGGVGREEGGVDSLVLANASGGVVPLLFLSEGFTGVCEEVPVFEVSEVGAGSLFVRLSPDSAVDGFFSVEFVLDSALY